MTSTFCFKSALTATKAIKAMPAMKAAKAVKDTKPMEAPVHLKDCSYVKFEREMVWSGEFDHTRSGLELHDLVKDKPGKIKIKNQVEAGKTNPWIAAVLEARTTLNIKGFQVIKKGTKLYIKAKALYKKKMSLNSAARPD